MKSRYRGKRLNSALMALAIFLFPATAAGDEETVILRFAVLGDAEPKPLAEFPNMAAAVEQLNSYGAANRLDFVAGIGDIAHKGTLLQYEAATPVLQALDAPFYPIMGNEEFNASEEIFLHYANLWNEGKGALTSRRYVQDHGPVILVFASPDFGRDFTDEGIDWILSQLDAAAPKPVFLLVHAAQAGAYPENAEKGVQNPRFSQVIARQNLAAIISGDLHMDMDRVDHSKQIDHVHYLHIPALERTKIPDETRHTPMYRIFTLTGAGEVLVDTFHTATGEPEAAHHYRFTLPIIAGRGEPR